MVPQDFQNSINSALEKFFAGKKWKLAKYDHRLGLLIDQIADLTLRGGDRMRPYFCWLGYQAAGGKHTNAILNAMLALELIQSYALIHDDFMDKAKRRRGGPTIHAYFTQNLRNQFQAASLAILAGDLCNLWAQELFSKNKPSTQTKDLFLSMQEEVIAGQIIDVWGMKFTPPPKILEMYRLKSASYCVEKPLLIGASLHLSSLSRHSPLYQTLTNYGRKVGVAFQLRDDELGVFGDEVKTGKPVSNDLIEGKWTYLIALAYMFLDDKVKEKFEKLFSKKARSGFDVKWLKSIIVQTGARKKQTRMMEKLIKEAEKETGKLKELNRNVKKLLDRFAHFAVERNN